MKKQVPPSPSHSENDNSQLPEWANAAAAPLPSKEDEEGGILPSSNIPLPEHIYETPTLSSSLLSQQKPTEEPLSSPSAILSHYWHYPAFRGIQLPIIESILSGHDTLGLMPTGGGKSITFQVPGLAMEGTCLVVSPLIALMKDQVQNLRRRGITAAAIYTGLSHDEVLQVLDNTIFNAYKFLYVSPERLGTKLFQQKLAHMHISFITVDEAHCISQWGYDFRPSYLQIAEVRKLLPDAPVLALTATATPEVVDDICAQLAFRPDSEVHRMSFARDNLAYVVRRTSDKFQELLHILNSVPGSAIVYERSRKGTAETAKALNEAGIRALYYHAGLTNVDKDVRQKAWQDDDTRVMVATNAFGMGIDKPDVRIVVHMDLPDSIEAYFQEAGRAGRDGKKAYAVLLYNNTDHGKLSRRVPETFPEKDYVREVYNKLAYFFQLAVGDGFNVRYEFNLDKFCLRFHCFPVPVVSALNLLMRAGYLHYEEESESTSRVQMLVSREELYHIRDYPEGNDVLKALLRDYSGLFSDYVNIEEKRLAMDSGWSEHEVYEILKGLTRRRILHYIPRKKTPYITFLQRRVEGKDIVLSPEVYDKRKAVYETRINSMLNYAAHSDTCRSRYLLHYFGEEQMADCAQCDVCLERAALLKGAPHLDAHILNILADRRPHRLAELQDARFRAEDLAATLEQLVEEERITYHNGRFRLNAEAQ